MNKSTNPHILKIANALELSGIAITETGIWEVETFGGQRHVTLFPLSGGAHTASGDTTEIAIGKTISTFAISVFNDNERK